MTHEVSGQFRLKVRKHCKVLNICCLLYVNLARISNSRFSQAVWGALKAARRCRLDSGHYPSLPWKGTELFTETWQLGQRGGLMDCERYLLRKKTREQMTPTDKSWVGQGGRACEYLPHHRVILSSNISRGRATVYQLLFSCREEQPFQFLSVERDLIQGITGIAKKKKKIDSRLGFQE